MLYRPFGAAGLAAATAVGAWINLLVLCAIGWLQNVVRPDDPLVRTAVAVDAAALLLGLYVFFAHPRLAAATAGLRFHDVTLLGLLGAGGAVVYGAALIGSLKLCGVNLGMRRRQRVVHNIDALPWTR